MKIQNMQQNTIGSLIYPSPEMGDLTGCCSICGLQSDGQFSREELLQKTSSNLTSIFDLHSATICAHCVGIWKEPKKYHRSIFATPERVIFPTIARESSTDERPPWSDVLKVVDKDVPRVAIITTDAKKRTWPFAKVSSGEAISIFLYDPSRCLSGNYSANIDALRDALNLIESIYSLGFVKDQIGSSLYSNQKLCVQIGFSAISSFERQLKPIRNTPEFYPALIVAQKPQEVK